MNLIHIKLINLIKLINWININLTKLKHLRTYYIESDMLHHMIKGFKGIIEYPLILISLYSKYGG